jgi:wyosine [tRNA(Phe)-imidazoG37] synthetase (radical SAM superfamily)
MKALQVEPDVITFSGMGEPTLAKNLNSAIEIVRKCTDIPLAILTNSSLMYNKEVREELKKLDIIVAKLDAANEDYFRKINQPGKGITFKKTLEGIKKMREGFKGKFALQTMFVQENALIAKEIAEIAREIDPNEIHINTPLRPCRVKPLPKKQLFEIEGLFKGLKTLNVYKCKKPNTLPLDMQELLERGRPVP